MHVLLPIYRPYGAKKFVGIYAIQYQTLQALQALTMYLVISYDIKDDKRRLNIHKVLKNYGLWVQYSVFECDLKKTEYLYLRHRLKQLLDDEEDSIRFYRLCETCKPKIERIGGIVPREGVTVVV